MNLKNLINIVKEETYKRINSEAIKEAEKESIAMTLAIAALKYADFLPFRSTDYVFEVEKFADLEGKTGPYLLYSTIRMKSLLNKVKEENIVANKVKLLNSDTENEIALTILNLPVALNKSLETKSLNEIAEYIYKLTSQYNKFYAENKVLTEKNKDLQESWIVITQTVYNINMLLLDILGINVPEKM
jgi:arginyl-tRNA synthetase